MHYIHTVRTYIFTYIYISRYSTFICLSVHSEGKVQYLFFLILLILYEIPEYLVFFLLPFSFLSPSSFLFLSG